MWTKSGGGRGGLDGIGRQAKIEVNAQIEVNGEAEDALIVHGQIWTTALQMFMDLIIVVVKYDSFFL